MFAVSTKPCFYTFSLVGLLELTYAITTTYVYIPLEYSGLYSVIADREARQ